MKIKSKWLLSLLLFICLTFYFIHSTNNSIKEAKITVENLNKISVKCEEILNSQEINENYKNCEEFLNSYSENDNYNFFSILTNDILDSINDLSAVMIIIVDCIAIIWINKILKNKYIINYYTRVPRKKFLRDLIIESYYILIPLALSVVTFLAYTYMNTNLIISEAAVSSSIWSYNTMNRPALFIIIYLFQFLLFQITYINIGLISSRKHSNYIISLISTYLFFLIAELFDEIIIDRILKFKYSSYLSIANCFVFDDRLGIYSPLLFPLCTFIISTLIVLLIYRKKEKLYLDCDCIK